jgi:outer membrane protein TolC
MSRTVMARQVRCTLVLAALSLDVRSTLAQDAPPPDVASHEVRPPVAPRTPAALLTGKAGGLTAEHLADRALATSFAAEQKRQQVVAAAANLDRALYDFMPRLSGQVSYFRLSAADAPSLGPLAASESPQNATTFTTSLTLPLSDYVLRLMPAHDAARAELDASHASLQATRRKTRYEARALYYDWVRAELEASAAAQNLELGQEHLEHLQALARAESASLADVARVEATVASSERVLVEARNLAALQRERIAIALHDPQPGELLIGEDLTRSPEGPEHDDIVELSRRAERLRPELAVAEHAARSYDAQARVSWSRVLPRLDALGQSTFANPNSRYFPQEDEFKGSWQVGLQLSFQLSDSLASRTQVSVAHAQAAEARAQRAELVDAVRVEVVEAVLAQRTARAGLASSSRRLAAAATSYRARRERFFVGAATTVELTEAQTELFNAELEAVQAEVAIRVARARVAYVSGN